MSHRARFGSSLLLLLLTVSTAHAGDELYLRWDNCIGDGGVYNRTFACDTNLGVETLVGSFRLAQTVVGVNEIQGTLEIASIDPFSLPLWWQIGTGLCRPANTISASFIPPGTSTNCLNGWAGNALGGWVYQILDPRYARIRVGAAVVTDYAFDVPAGQETYAFTISIKHTGTIGLGSCAGCSTPACIAWGQAVLHQVPNYLPTILGSATPGNGSNVTWQPGAVATTYGSCPPNRPCDSYVTCQSATPARGSTWGSIKSLYR